MLGQGAVEKGLVALHLDEVLGEVLLAQALERVVLAVRRPRRHRVPRLARPRVHARARSCPRCAVGRRVVKLERRERVDRAQQVGVVVVDRRVRVVQHLAHEVHDGVRALSQPPLDLELPRPVEAVARSLALDVGMPGKAVADVAAASIEPHADADALALLKDVDVAQVLAPGVAAHDRVVRLGAREPDGTRLRRVEERLLLVREEPTRRRQDTRLVHLVRRLPRR